jgi:F0F1-type ATP synthase membrane subunit b/b'
LLTLTINLLIVLVMLAVAGALLYENANSVVERVSSQIRETLVQGQAIAEQAVELKQDLSSSLQNLPKIAALGNVKL